MAVDNHRLQREVPQESRPKDALLVFSSHFFTKLVEEGTVSVQKWTARKDVNIFEKRMVFIPIYRSDHWSLCVVVNPGARSEPASPDALASFIIFLDPKKGGWHDQKLVRKNVMAWLNAEWRRLKDESKTATRCGPFTNATMHFLTPIGKFCNILLHGLVAYLLRRLTLPPFVSSLPTE
jgi:Ulp1 family protease